MESERDGLYGLVAFTKDELLIVREDQAAMREDHARQLEAVRSEHARQMDAMREDHAAVIAGYRQDIADLTAALSAQADAMLGLQARAVDPQDVDVRAIAAGSGQPGAVDHANGTPTGKAPERPSEALQCEIPPFVGMSP